MGLDKIRECGLGFLGKTMVEITTIGLGAVADTYCYK